RERSHSPSFAGSNPAVASAEARPTPAPVGRMPYARVVPSSPSRAPSSRQRRMNPWLRLFIPLALVLLATAAIWAPKLGWFDALGSGSGSSDSGGSASGQGVD